ncbi:MAG: sigma-70 family RNA polymerase sigma factor [Planctomycetota bacterium]
MRVDRRFARFQRTRQPKDLAAVFEATAPELLRVAAYLAGDPHAAEDMVQATFVAAIESVDAYDTGRPVVPWLLGILVHRAAQFRQQRRRDVDPARLAERIAEAPIDVAEREELVQRCQGALAELPASYRQVLQLHFEHGLTYREIARALERPEGTVRTQAVRGLELLRRALPATLTVTALAHPLPGSAGLRAMREALLRHAAAVAPRSAAVPIYLAGGILVNKSMGLGVAVAGASSVALAALLWWGRPFSSQPAPAPPRSGPAAVLRAEPVAATTPTPRAVPLREELVAAALPAALGTLRVVLASAEAPAVALAVADLGVLVWPASAGATRPPRRAQSDARGVAELCDLAAGRYRVGLDRCAVTAAVDIVSGRTTTVELSLPAALHVRGRVLTAAGAPAPAQLWAIGVDGQPYGRLLGHADPQGRFALGSVAPGLRLWARLAGHAPSNAEQLHGATGAEIEVSLTLGRPSAGLSGQVLAAGGDAVPHATVVLFLHTDRVIGHRRAVLVRADGQGRFESREIPPGEHLAVARDDSATHPGLAHRRFTCASHEARRLDLTLRAAAVVRGTVRDAAGAPLAGVAVRARAGIANLPPLTYRFTDRAAATAADGTYGLDGLLPGQYQLVAGPPGQRRGQTVELGVSEALEWNPVLDPGLPLAVRVVEPSGAPVPDCEVRLEREGHPFAVRSLRTGTDGRGRFEELRAGVYSASLHSTDGDGEASPFPMQVHARLQPGPNEQALVLASTARWAAPVRGRLCTADGKPLRNAAVTVSKPGWSVFARHYTDPRGRFAIGPLPAAEYRLAFAPEGYARLVRLVDVANEAVELGDVVLAKPAEMLILVRDTSGGAVSGARVSLELTGDAPHRAEASDEGGGRYRATALRAGRYRVRVAGARFVPIEREVATEPGAPAEVSVTVQAAASVRFVLRFPAHADRATHAFCDWVVRDADGVEIARRRVIETFADLERREVVDRLGLAPGRYGVEVRDRALPWRGAAEFVVGTGDTDVDVAVDVR